MPSNDQQSFSRSVFQCDCGGKRLQLECVCVRASVSMVAARSCSALREASGYCVTVLDWIKCTCILYFVF